MTVTYDLSSSDPAILLISRLRLELGDKAVGEGVLPDGSNFQDLELQNLLTRAGSDVEIAASIACDILATTWAKVADITIGPRREALSQVASRYEKRAKQYRDRLGISTIAFSGGMTRADGYETYETGQEYTP